MFEYVVTLDQLQVLPNLNDERTKNKEVAEALKRDFNTAYKIVKPNNI